MPSGKSPSSSRPLKRHELWRLQYRQRRYLKLASDDVLAQRTKDVIANFATLNSEGKISVLPLSPEGEHWMILWTHVLEEYELRRRGLPLANDLRIPTPTAPNVPDAVRALKGIDLPDPGKALIKLGKKEHMKALYELGNLRISPASSYSDPSLNHAVQDDELEFDRTMPGEEVTITFMDKKAGQLRTAKPISDVTQTTSLATDFYVCCMTHSLSYRLFDDFEADACVIIRNPGSFWPRLQKAVAARLPGWLDWHREVQYIDPYLHKEKELNLIFAKHFRHWYQQEYRFAWIPEKGEQKDLEPINIELGSLRQIADIVFI